MICQKPWNVDPINCEKNTDNQTEISNLKSINSVLNCMKYILSKENCDLSFDLSVNIFDRSFIFKVKFIHFTLTLCLLRFSSQTPILYLYETLKYTHTFTLVYFQSGITSRIPKFMISLFLWSVNYSWTDHCHFSRTY